MGEIPIVVDGWKTLTICNGITGHQGTYMQPIVWQTVKQYCNGVAPITQYKQVRNKIVTLKGAHQIW